MQILIEIISSFGAAVAFALIIKVPSIHFFAAGITGSISWISYQIFINLLSSDVIAAFIASVLVALISIFLARRQKVPMNNFIFPGVFPLVPGISAYQAMNFFMAEEFLLGMKELGRTFSISLSIAFAIVIVESFYKFIIRVKK